ELPVHHRRIIEDEKLLAARRSVALDQLEAISRKRLGELPRVGDCRGAADELRLRAIKLADAPETPQKIGKMTPIYAAVVMQLVHYHIPQVLEELCPTGVMRQDSGVQHVRIRKDHVRALPDGFAGVLRRVPIES